MKKNPLAVGVVIAAAVPAVVSAQPAFSPTEDQATLDRQFLGKTSLVLRLNDNF